MKKIFLFFALLVSASLFASSFEHVQKDCSYLSVTPSSIPELLSEWFHLDDHVSFVESRVVNDQIGMTHRTLQQYVDGVPVKGGLILVHCQSNGLVKSVNGDLLRVDASCLSQSASYSRKALRAKYTNNAGDNNPIVWVSCVKDGRNVTRKAYKVDVASEYKTIYVDVTTGEVLKEDSHINSLSGTAYTVYSGWQNIEYSSEDGKNILYDETRDIYTVDASTLRMLTDGSDVDMSTAEDFINPNNRWAVQYLQSVTLSTADQDWWYNWLTDTEGDFYIKVKSLTGELLYTSNYTTDRNPPITFTIPSNVLIPVQDGIKIEIWDYDGISEGGVDDDGGSKTVTQKTAGTYTWSNSKTTGSYVIGEHSHPALDVHWGMERVWDYYLATFNHRGFDGNNGPTLHLVNPPTSLPVFAGAGFPYQACAFGGSGIFAYGYGGSANDWSFVVAIDVMGHEFTHAVTAANGEQNLPNYGEGGALNESFGDIIGNAIEKFAKGSCDWLVGAEITNNGHGLRSMKNPAHSYFNDPKTYLTSSNWNVVTGSPTPENDMDGVHSNCGVQNYWFYLLCQGGSGTNDNGETYNIIGIGMDKAIQIVYRNLLYYITSESEYPQSRTGSILAAQDLLDNNQFGITAADVQTVKDAWDAVGVYDYSLQPGKYVIYADATDAWFISSNLTTTSTKRFVADTIAGRADLFYVNADPAFVWNVTKNADGTYVFESNGKYMSWTSGNSGAMSTTPKNLDVTFDPNSYGYIVSFKASETETRTLSYNTANGSQYFAFYGNTNQNHILYFVEAFDMDTITVRAKLPSNWGNTIRAWVWYDGEDGEWATPTLEDDWYVYSGLGEYNIIFVNGTTWNGDNNQTVDIAVHGDMCIMVDSNTSGKRTYGQIECEPELVVPDCKALPYSESFASNQGEFTIENVALDGLGYVWTFASGYGMKASAYVSSVNHPTESWLISPCLELPEDATINLTFDHVYRYTTTPTADLTLLVSEDYVSGAPSAATWTPIAIPTYSSGSNWTFVNAGNINLNAYAGKNVTLAFRYKSSSSAAATWEIKNVSVTSSSISTGIGNAINLNNVTKCIIDGHLFILRGDQLYDATGRRVE